MRLKFFKSIHRNIFRNPHTVQLSSACLFSSKREDVIENGIQAELEEDKEFEAFSNRYFGCSSFHNCFVIHPYIKWGKSMVTDTVPEKQIEEAVSLIRTLAPWKVQGTFKQPLNYSQMQTSEMFGKGTLRKLKETVKGDPSITAIFMNVSTLRNDQMKALETEFRLPVFDRYNIIMKILKFHATSVHAKLQVALAELPYLKKRINEIEMMMSDNPETNKLIFQKREQKIKNALKKLKVHRNLLRKQRDQAAFPIVAVVGYTNAGKTSLIKALTGDGNLHPKNYLFATLDVTMHGGTLPSNLKVLYVDTIGFISNIPTDLIECFVVTLEDAMLADIIVHVEDLSSDNLLHQRNHVLATLKQLAAKTGSEDLLDKIITVGNKVDLVTESVPIDGDVVVSSKTQLGIDNLRHKLDELVLKYTDRKVLTIRVRSGSDEMTWLYKNSAVQAVTVDEKNCEYQNVKVIITKPKLEQFKHIFIKQVGKIIPFRINKLINFVWQSSRKMNA